jgi:hypothetical protein
VEVIVSQSNPDGKRIGVNLAKVNERRRLFKREQARLRADHGEPPELFQPSERYFASLDRRLRAPGAHMAEDDFPLSWRRAIGQWRRRYIRARVPRSAPAPVRTDGIARPQRARTPRTAITRCAAQSTSDGEPSSRVVAVFADADDPTARAHAVSIIVELIARAGLLDG